MEELNKTTKRDIFMVDPRNIFVEDGANTRTDYSLDDIIDSIRENGVKVPLLCYKDKGEERYYVIAGHRRIMATHKLIAEGVDIARIPVMKMDKPSDIDRTVLMIVENDGKPFTTYELAVTYKRLIDYGFTVTEIAKKIGKTASHVSQTLDILKLPQELKEEVKNNAISATMAKEVSKSVKLDRIGEVIEKAPKNEKGKRDIKLDEIEDEIRSEGSKKKVKHNVTSCQNCPVCMPIDNQNWCAFSGEIVTPYHVGSKLPSDCPLETQVITIKLN
jgi:ParB family chromosome partitioning protein